MPKEKTILFRVERKSTNQFIDWAIWSGYLLYPYRDDRKTLTDRSKYTYWIATDDSENAVLNKLLSRFNSFKEEGPYFEKSGDLYFVTISQKDDHDLMIDVVEP